MEEEHICTLCSFNYSRWGKKRCPRSLCHRYELPAPRSPHPSSPDLQNPSDELVSVMGVQGELLKLLDQLRR